MLDLQSCLMFFIESKDIEVKKDSNVCCWLFAVIQRVADGLAGSIGGDVALATLVQRVSLSWYSYAQLV